MRRLSSLLTILCAPIICAAALAAAPPLPAPRLMKPAGDRQLDFASPISWQPVAGARTYNVEICADAACTRVIERADAIMKTWWQPAKHEPGAYAVRITAIGDNGDTGESATTPFTISFAIGGHVFDDAQALALPQHFTPVTGATVKLFRDGGDGRPTADDVLVSSAQTASNGEYAFHPAQRGTYFVAVDSKSIARGAAAWPEQTFAPVGGFCTLLDGTTIERNQAGACFGGRRLAASDDAVSAATSEHIVRVVAGEALTNADFAFSFNAVTSLDDAAADAKPIQGSFRQFLANANAIPGANAMRFVPLVKPKSVPDPSGMSVPTQSWAVHVQRPLPALVEAGTTIDGTAYSFVAPNSPLSVSRGRIGTELPAVQNVTDITDLLKPELEIVAAPEVTLTCEGGCTIRNVAVYGAATSIITRGDSLIDHAIIGATSDAAIPSVFGTTGIQIERGTTKLREVYVGYQRTAGIIAVGADARLDADRIHVTGCGGAASGSAIALVSNASVIRHSAVESNLGAGIVIGLPGGNQPAKYNVIESTTLSGNLAGIVLGAGASDNVILRDELMWNRVGGVVAAPFAGIAIPVRNRITGSHFNENGGRPISLDPNLAVGKLMASSTECMHNTAAANGGVAPPKIESVEVEHDAAGKEVIVVLGLGCAVTQVELYLSYATKKIRENTNQVERIHMSDTPDGTETIAGAGAGQNLLPS
ncbi:MAG: putative internalin, partial [Acidobacteria bacterium]|nr:putative internalin [Acidobacteriota bacterium]